MCDVHKGLHLEFMKRGVPVYTAGHTSDVFFADRLYSYMRQFKYIVSNDIGSYTYYSVEMGIPFSFFGDAEKINLRDPNLPIGHFDLSSRPGYKEEVDVFSGIHTRITPRQKELVEHVMGIGKGLSGDELRQILLDAHQKRNTPAKTALRIYKRRAKYGAIQLAARFLDFALP